MNATWMLQQRDAKVTYVGWANMDLVEGNMVSLINNKDKSRTSAAVYMHENKLYILEGTAPAGYPVPDWFQQSVGWIDENGNGIRYLTIYHNGLPKPEIARLGGPGPGQGRNRPGGRRRAESRVAVPATRSPRPVRVMAFFLQVRRPCRRLELLRRDTRWIFVDRKLARDRSTRNPISHRRSARALIAHAS